MATTKQATPLQRLMRRIQDLPTCPLCKRKECECWTPLSDMEKANADLLAACEHAIGFMEYRFDKTSLERGEPAAITYKELRAAIAKTGQA